MTKAIDLNIELQKFIQHYEIETCIFSCPNDTFMFDAMIHHKVDTEGLELRFSYTTLKL